MTARWKTAALCLAACAALGAPNLQATGLVEKFFPGKKEAEVAQDWFARTLPETLRQWCSRNEFAEALAALEKNAPPVRVEIHDVSRNNQSFIAYRKLLKEVDTATGKAVYTVEKKPLTLRFADWEPRHVALCYDVALNPADADVTGFAAWLYHVKQPRLARRALAVLHRREQSLRPLIAAWIAAAEKLPGETVLEPYIELEQYKDSELEFTLRHETLLTAAEKQAREQKRDFEARERLLEIQNSLGDYAKPLRDRKNRPRKLLRWIKWDIHQFREHFSDSKFATGAATKKTLEQMEKSIEDDIEAVVQALARVAAMKPPVTEREAEDQTAILRRVRSLDPLDSRVDEKIAQTWFDFAQVNESATSSLHERGVKEAMPFYIGILKRRPGHTGFMLKLAQCHRVLRQFDDMERLCREILRLDGDDKGEGPKAAAMLR